MAWRPWRRPWRLIGWRQPTKLYAVKRKATHFYDMIVQQRETPSWIDL